MSQGYLDRTRWN